jgi:hypothetical protein
MRGTGPRRPWLYDPSLGGVLVRGHRPPAAGTVGSVVSDVVWSSVLGVLRWAEATLTCRVELAGGSAWRTAAASAALLRMLPGLCSEVGVPWTGAVGEPVPAVMSAAERLRTAADRLALRLCSPDGRDDRPVVLAAVLAELAGAVDEVGAAAIAVLLEGADWTVTD